MNKIRTINSLINRCVTTIESNLNWDIGADRSRRDYDILVEKIFETTGILLSISTLRRIWNDEYKKIPHRSTLDALASMAGYIDWQNFVEENNTDNKADIKNDNNWILLGLIATLIIIFGLFSLYYFSGSPDKIKIDGPLKFSYHQKASFKVPNIIVFDYDVSNIVADSFFIVESAHDYRKKKINLAVGHMTSSYFNPGNYEAFLIADDSIIRKLNIEILTNSWVGILNYKSCNKEVPFYFYDSTIIQKGKLCVDKELIEKNDIRIDDDLYSSLSNTFQSKLSHKDGFIFKTRVRLDSIEINASCPEIHIVLLFEKDICYIPLVQHGGQGRVQVKYGKTYLTSTDSDLSGFGCNIYNWQNVKLEAAHSRIDIFLNERLIASLKDTTEMGEFRGFSYTFDGIGSVDYVSLKSVLEDTSFFENFETEDITDNYLHKP